MNITMATLRDAMLEIGRARDLPADAPELAVGIACSFSPLHLQTYLQASVQAAAGDRRVSMIPGLYGPVVESIQHVAGASPDLCAVVLEWPDLDPRLGIRESATAPRADLEELSATAEGRLNRLHQALTDLAGLCPVAVLLPSLDLPAIYAAPSGRVGLLEARLSVLVAQFSEKLLAVPGIRVVDPEIASRRDVQSDLRSGFPYTSTRAAELAGKIARTLVPLPTKKGLITDLDDTLWRGLVGEVGIDAVSWDLDSGSLVHALYQLQLQELSRRGILIGVCSKNDPEVVAGVLTRADLLVSSDVLFPVEASWGPKSAAVDRILRTWNISASDVVFVDDNDHELAEVAAAHPNLTCLKFPTLDPRGAGVLLEELNALFWREQVTAEDALRTTSLRASAAVAVERERADDPVQFLRDLEGRVTVEAEGVWESARAVELINKTNQFNLNGRRVVESEWRKRGARPGSVGCSISYADKFGTLGAISVLSGVVDGDLLTIDCWVLSCRAFSRGIEHHVLRALFDQYGVARIAFDFVRTERNAVAAQLLSTLGYDVDDPRGIDVRAVDGTGMTGVHQVDVRRST